MVTAYKVTCEYELENIYGSLLFSCFFSLLSFTTQLIHSFCSFWTKKINQIKCSIKLRLNKKTKHRTKINN